MAKKKAAAKTEKKPPTKSQLFANIAEATGLTKKQVAAVFDALTDEIRKNLSRRGPGQITIPGLMKVVRKKVPARPARKGRDPRTGEERIFPAKPASVTVRVRALKGLKEMVAK